MTYSKATTDRDGRYVETYDDSGRLIGESRLTMRYGERTVVHTDRHGVEIGTSVMDAGWGLESVVTTNSRGGFVERTQEASILDEDDLEHVNRRYERIGGSRERDGLLGPYVEHGDTGWMGAAAWKLFQAEAEGEEDGDDDGEDASESEDGDSRNDSDGSSYESDSSSSTSTESTPEMGLSGKVGCAVVPAAFGVWLLHLWAGGEGAGPALFWGALASLVGAYFAYSAAKEVISTYFLSPGGWRRLGIVCLLLAALAGGYFWLRNRWERRGFEDAPGAAESWTDVLDGSSLGQAQGVEWVSTPAGTVARFRRADHSRIEYSGRFPREGTLVMRVWVKSGYGYQKGLLTTTRRTAVVFSTDNAGADVAWPGASTLFVNDDGTLEFTMTTVKYGTAPNQIVRAEKTPFRFEEWHTIGVSWGSEGQAIAVDGQVRARMPGNRQRLGFGGNHESPADVPTIGETRSACWRPGLYAQGFEGRIARVRVSGSQNDWRLALEAPADTGGVRR